MLPSCRHSASSNMRSVDLLSCILILLHQVYGRCSWFITNMWNVVASCTHAYLVACYILLNLAYGATSPQSSLEASSRGPLPPTDWLENLVSLFGVRHNVVSFLRGIADENSPKSLKLFACFLRCAWWNLPVDALVV